MDATQTSQFTAAAGRAPGATYGVFGAIVIIFAVVWLAWIALQLFDAWRNGRIDFFDLAAYLLRGAVALSILLVTMT